MDLSFIADWFTNVSSFFQAIWDFVNSGIYQFVADALEVVTIASVYAMLLAKLECMHIAYNVVQQILTDSGAVAMISKMWGTIPGDVQSTLAFFNVPQGLTLILTAIPTRMVMRFVPGIGS